VLSEEAWRMAAPYFGNVPLDVALPRGALVSDGEFARSVFYNEILRPARGFHGVGARLRGPGSLVASINICRPERIGAYETADAEALQRVLPHLAMALEVRTRIGAANGESRTLERLLDRFATAALIVDGSARLRFRNACAERLLTEGDGLGLSPAGLVAATPALTRDLRAAVTRAAGLKVGSVGSLAAAIRVSLPRPSLRPALRITLTPAWRLDDGASPGAVALLVTEPDAPPPIDQEALADSFRLTRREAEVAILLAGGLDVAAIAAALDVGRGTVRFHLKHVFLKTGASSQAALVALARGFTRADFS
jgi:DNA-binding CsgD family transcriptional regulator